MVGQMCYICQGEASKCCGGCREVYYCGKEHQKLDWLRHKLICKPFKVCENEVLGRHLVATRDIKAGEVVLKEIPLLRGPSQVTGPVCLSCLQSISQYNSKPCERCGWPLCLKPTCRQSDQHRPECQWTIEKRKSPVKITQFISPHPSYECITTLRMCYAREQNPGLWSKLSALQSHSEQRKNTRSYLEDTKSIVQFLKRFYKIENDLSESEIMECWGIIQVNGHEVPVSQPAHVAVYDMCSMLEHSCYPNCSKSFTSTGAIIIRAMAKIPQGSHLSISYTDSLWGTVNRQYHLLDTKFFSCQCERCVDVTELGTYFSALLCDQSGCTGTMLPESLCKMTTDSPWTCSRCGHILPDKQVENLLHQAGQELSMLSTQTVQKSLGFLDKWKSKFHSNHYYLTEVKLALAQRMGQECRKGIQDLTDEYLEIKTNFCRQLLKLLPAIAPAECRVLGVLNFELHAALADKARRDPYSGNLHLALMESRTCLEKTIYLLEQEPEILPEGKLLIQAELNKLELDKTLQAVHSLTSSIPAM